ncbi:MAG: aspartyl protease family protein [Myxococcota bacterium]|nr:aspartyl protease family protein [Myxococcota bacterium]
MGHVFQKVRLSGRREREVTMLVDTGATYSMIGPELADDLGVQRSFRQTVVLADGRRIEADLGQMMVQIEDRRAGAQVLIAPCDEPLLGVEALEVLGLAVDPTAGTLKPTRAYAVRLGGVRGDADQPQATRR